MDNGIMKTIATFSSSTDSKDTSFTLKKMTITKSSYQNPPLTSKISNMKTNYKRSAIVTKTTYIEPKSLDVRLYPKEKYNKNYVDNSDSNLVMANMKSRRNINKSASDERWRFSRIMSTSSTSAIFYLILYIFLTTADLSLAARQDAPTNCTFPQRWEGSWFLSGYQQSIHIKGSQFSYRGKCAASDGNKYLLVDERGCHRCLVIYEKHKNVLQYKESECDGDSMYMDQSNPAALPMRSLSKSDHRGAHPNNNNGHSRLSSSDQYIMRSNDDMSSCSYCRGRETLQTLCDQIPGDALLYSLFRENAEPVKCPLKGPFSFTYNRGHGECKSPVSNIDSCTEESRLLLSFQACPDVQGTESTDEELTCLATWKDGNSRYLVGLVSHHHAISNEDRYRCFVYERISSMMGGHGSGIRDGEYKLAQSGDATCNGLDSAEVGSRIMTLRKPTPAERCDFPSWFKGPRHWHALMGNSLYNYHQNDGSMQIIKGNGVMETRALCEQINKQTSTEMMAVVQHTTGCNTGFMCMMFYRRDTHVIEIQSGKPANRLEDACAPDYFDFNTTPFITLLAKDPDPQICPLEGLYFLHGAIGPPYVSSRHKRNHNGKHNHHHHRHGISSLSSAAVGASYRTRRAASGPEALPLSSHSVELPLNPVDENGNGVIETSSLKQLNRNSNIKNSQKDGAELNAVIMGNGDIRRNRRDASGCVINTNARRHLWIGCTAPNIIDVRPNCNTDGEEEYSCHGSWMENGTTFMVARHKSTKHLVCITYRPTELKVAKLIIGDTCYRGIFQPPEHLLVSNITHYGKCGDPSGSSSLFPTAILTLSAILTAIVYSGR